MFLGVRQRRTSEMSQVTILAQAKLEFKVAKTTALLTLAMNYTLLSGGVFLVLGDSFPAFRENASFRIAETLVLLNSVINPLIYCHRDRRIRNAMLEILRIRKPTETHRMEDAAPSGGTKEQFDPVESEHLQLQHVEKRLKRSSFYDQPSFCYGRRSHSEMVKEKRSVSAPSISIVFDHDAHNTQYNLI